jgi:hypothetical protein
MPAVQPLWVWGTVWVDESYQRTLRQADQARAEIADYLDFVAQLRRHFVLLGEREESPEPKRFFAKSQGRIEWILSLCEREWDLLGETRPDMVVRTHTEGVETQRLFALASRGNHDRGPFDLVRLTAGQPPVRVEQYLEMRPGTDMMPAAPVLGHRLLDPRSLHYIPPFQSID